MDYIYVDEDGVGYFVDGNMYGAVREATFVNIQESVCGFGHDYEAAKQDLLRNEAGQ